MILIDVCISTYFMFLNIYLSFLEGDIRRYSKEKHAILSCCDLCRRQQQSLLKDVDSLIEDITQHDKRKRTQENISLRMLLKIIRMKGRMSKIEQQQRTYMKQIQEMQTLFFSFLL